METVFSYWSPQPDGSVRSKLDLIENLQAAGYFVLLMFVGLAAAELSVLRVKTRVTNGGHAVDLAKLRARFPRTQLAVRQATQVADASILVDNSRTQDDAFTVCRVQLGDQEAYDIRAAGETPPVIVLDWLNIVCPRPAAG
jgi:predicted ABC-type ATPase